MSDSRSPELLAAIHALPLIECRALEPKIDYWATGNWYDQAGKRVRLKKHVKANTIYPGARGLAAIVRTDTGDELVVGPREVLFDAKTPVGSFDRPPTPEANPPAPRASGPKI